MTDKKQIEDLISRLEKAQGPDRKLDGYDSGYIRANSGQITQDLLAILRPSGDRIERAINVVCNMDWQSSPENIVNALADADLLSVSGREEGLEEAARYHEQQARDHKEAEASALNSGNWVGGSRGLVIGVHERAAQIFRDKIKSPSSSTQGMATGSSIGSSESQIGEAGPTRISSPASSSTQAVGGGGRIKLSRAEVDRITEVATRFAKHRSETFELDLSRVEIVEGSSTPLAEDGRAIIAGIRQFGLAADGSDLRDLEALLSRSSTPLPAIAEGVREALAELIAAIDAGSIEMNSPEGGGHDNIPPRPWHEEWLHRAREALSASTAPIDGEALGEYLAKEAARRLNPRDEGTRYLGQAPVERQEDVVERVQKQIAMYLDQRGDGLSHEDLAERLALCLDRASLLRVPEAAPVLDGWKPIDENTPKDRFIVVYCPEDNSRWLAKWQEQRWHGVDEMGLSREGMGPQDVTGWRVTLWQEFAAAPKPTGRE